MPTRGRQQIMVHWSRHLRAQVLHWWEAPSSISRREIGCQRSLVLELLRAARVIESDAINACNLYVRHVLSSFRAPWVCASHSTRVVAGALTGAMAVVFDATPVVALLALAPSLAATSRVNHCLISRPSAYQALTFLPFRPAASRWSCDTDCTSCHGRTRHGNVRYRHRDSWCP
eukprot:COSAG02_NODE_111_length_36009_cov_42.221248_23_plen_174_part_00